MELVDEYKNKTERELKKLGEENPTRLAEVAHDALAIVKVIDDYASRSNEMIVKKYIAIQKQKRFDNQRAFYGVDNNASEMSKYLNCASDQHRIFTAAQIMTICDNVGIPEESLLFQEDILEEISYIPYYLYPMRCSERNPKFQKLRRSAKKEVYIFGIGFKETLCKQLWTENENGANFRILIYDFSRYKEKELDREHFNDIIAEESYVQDCLKSREVVENFQKEAQDTAVEKIKQHSVEKKAGQIKVIHQSPEFRYYSDFFPWNITLVDPGTGKGAALFETILPFIKMSYKELDYGDKNENKGGESMPRFIVRVTEKGSPVFFNVIKTFIKDLWDKAGKEQNAQREIAKRLMSEEGFADDTVIAAYTGLTADEVKELRTQIE